MECKEVWSTWAIATILRTFPVGLCVQVFLYHYYSSAVFGNVVFEKRVQEFISIVSNNFMKSYLNASDMKTEIKEREIIKMKTQNSLV